MREFNTLGPVNPQRHYHVNRVAAKAALYERIAKGRYLTLNAARQVGKTTLFREIISELEATDEYFVILLDFEQLAEFKGKRFYDRLSGELERWRQTYSVALPNSLPKPIPMRDHGDFIDWLRATVRTISKKGVLIIDEFDAVAVGIIKPILSLMRGMYLERDAPKALQDALHSIILVGVRNLPTLLEGTQSPFNIADQFTVPYFSPEEVTELFGQRTAETGQIFTPDVITGIMRESEGQPFLVNRLAQILTGQVVTEPRQTITTSHLEVALAYLVNDNNTHFSSIVSKAIPHRQMLLPMLFYNETRSNLRESVTAELLMYGVLRTIESETGIRLARIANSIYRKVLILTFSPALDRPLLNGALRHQHIANGTLNFDALLEHFKAFMREHGVRLIKSVKTQRPLEISGQYLLLSYLSASLDSMQGSITIESVSSAGEMDILAFYRGQRFITETKIWYDKTRYQEGKEQLARYLQASGLTKGYMIIFDEKLEDNPVLEEKGEIFEELVNDKLLRIYLIGVIV